MRRKARLVAAAVAGIVLGAGGTLPASAKERADVVRCFGVDTCGFKSKCAVSQQDLDAVRTLLGDEAYAKSYGKSTPHSCAAKATCGPPDQILNWLSTTAKECHAKGGIIVETKDGKTAARKA